MTCEQTQELITALVDQEIAATDRTELEGHLKGCARCQWVLKQEQLLKSATRRAGSRVSAPADLKRRILSDPRIFPEASAARGGWRDLFAPARSWWRPAFALGIVVLLVLPTLFLLQPQKEPIALAALETHEKIIRREISFVTASSREELKAKLSRAVAGEFAPMGYDLSMVRLNAVGGTLREAQGRKILVTVYEGDNSPLTCYTFLGKNEDAPNGSQITFDTEKNILFYSFSSGGLNAVLHREGKVICILVSKMPMEDLLAVARAKAQPV